MAGSDPEANIESYLREVMGCADGPLDESIQELRSDLMKIAASKGLGELNPNKLDKALGKLKEATKTQFNKNMAKFMLYSVRNVFNPPSSSSVSGSSNTNSSIDTDLHSNAELAELEKEIANKRALYQKARREYQQITSNSRDMNSLIKEMRNALFTLRVASQSFEELGSHSLEDATALIQQHRVRLVQCMEQGKELLNKLNDNVEVAEDEEDNMGDTGTDDSKGPSSSTIPSGDASSIQKIVQGLHGK
eukprot:gene169-179_t